MLGHYTFRPIQANLTHDTEWLGKMDPYCSYRTGATKIKGPVCRNGGKFPKWEDAAVNVPATGEPSMVVDLMDKDKILADDNIGSFVIDLAEIQRTGQISKWYPVYWRERPAGEILMEAAFHPQMVQQHVVEPVLVKQTIVEQPVIVEKVIREEVVQAPHHTHQEFVSGPIIHGTSQIHHGGQGIGLVPQHGGIVTEGTHHHHGTHQGILHQGGLHQGELHQGGLQQGGVYQGGLQQGGLQQGGLQQGGIHQAGLQQGGLQQGGLHQGEFAQGGLNQGNLQQGGLNQGSNFHHGNFQQ